MIRWGLGITLAGVVILRLVPLGIREGRQALESQRARREQLWRARDELAGVPALEDSARRLAAPLTAAAGHLLAGHTTQDALADLTDQLRGRAWRSRARLARVASLPDSTTAGRLRRVSVVATLQGDVQSVVGLLASFHGESPLIVPTRLGVVATDPVGTARGSEVLEIEIRAIAWFLAGAAR